MTFNSKFTELRNTVFFITKMIHYFSEEQPLMALLHCLVLSQTASPAALLLKQDVTVLFILVEKEVKKTP